MKPIFKEGFGEHIADNIEQTVAIPTISEITDINTNTRECMQEPFLDDNGKDIANANNQLAANITFELFDVEYKTDDKGKIYSIDGNLVPNTEYTLDEEAYCTDDKGDVHSVENAVAPDENEINEIKGGSYKEVRKTSNGETHEVHHMPSDSSSPLERNDGPAIKMEKEDHRQTASCGSSREAREYQQMQRELIEDGKFLEALQMDIDDIHEKFEDKYDDAIAEMMEYVDELIKEGKIQ